MQRRIQAMTLLVVVVLTPLGRGIQLAADRTR
jgi:hypothetical protein